MASKNVIREDIVQISFNVKDDPLNDLVKSLQALQASVTKVVDEITSKFSKVVSSTNNIAEEIKGAGKEAVTTGDRFNKMVSEISKIPTAKLREMPTLLDSSAIAAKNFMKSFKNDIFTGNLSNIGSALKNVGNTASNVAGKVQSFVSKPYKVVLKASDEVSSILNGISSKILNIKNAVAGLVTTGLAAKAVGFVADQQDLQAQYKILLGSKEAADETVERLIEFAGTTPYTRDDIFQANRQLLVFGGTALAAEKTLRLVGDTASGTGQNFSDTAYRIGQLYSAIKSGNSPGIYIKSLQQTGALTSEAADELEKLSESGAAFEVKWAAVETALGRYSGTMEEMSKNMNNLMLSLKAFVKQKFIVPLGQGIVDSLQPAIEEFQNWRMENAQTISAWGDKIKEAATLITGKLIAGVKNLIGFAGKLKDTFTAFYHSDKGQTIVNTLKTIVDTVISNKDKILAVISAVAGAISTLLIINKVKTAFLGFTKVFGVLSSTAMVVIGIFALLFYAFQNDIGGIRELFSKLSDTFIKLGEKIVPLVCSALNVLISSVLPVLEGLLSGLIGFLNTNLNWIVPLVLGIAGAFSAFKVAVAAVNAVMLIQKGIIIAVKAVMIVWKAVTLAVQAAQWLLNAALLANPIVLIITLIAGLIAAFILLWNNCEDFRNFWIGLWDTIVSGVSAACDWIVNLFTKWIPEAFGKAINSFVELWENIKRIFFDAVGAIASFFTESIPKLIGDICNWFAELPGRIWNAIIGAVQKVADWGGQLLAKGCEAAQNLANGILNILCELPGKMLEIGQNIVSGIWNGISNAVGWITDRIKEFANGILDGMKSVLGIHSPSVLFRDEVGRNLALGLGQGFVSSMDNVRNEMQKALPTSFGTKLNMDVNTANRMIPGTDADAFSDSMTGYEFSEYTPENSGTTDCRTNYESNTYSPQFNLTVNGSATDRTTQRQLKEFMKEAMQEAFESMQRRSPALLEV